MLQIKCPDEHDQPQLSSSTLAPTQLPSHVLSQISKHGSDGSSVINSGWWNCDNLSNRQSSAKIADPFPLLFYLLSLPSLAPSYPVPFFNQSTQPNCILNSRDLAHRSLTCGLEKVWIMVRCRIFYLLLFSSHANPACCKLWVIHACAFATKHNKTRTICSRKLQAFFSQAGLHTHFQCWLSKLIAHVIPLGCAIWTHSTPTDLSFSVSSLPFMSQELHCYMQLLVQLSYMKWKVPISREEWILQQSSTQQKINANDHWMYSGLVLLVSLTRVLVSGQWGRATLTGSRLIWVSIIKLDASDNHVGSRFQPNWLLFNQSLHG